MSDRLNRKRLFRLTAMALVLMLGTIGVTFLGLYVFSQWQGY